MFKDNIISCKMKLPRRLLAKLFMDNYELSQLWTWSMYKVLYFVLDKRQMESLMNAQKGDQYCATIGDVDAFKLIINKQPESIDEYQCLLHGCMFNRLNIVKYICESLTNHNILSNNYHIFRETCSSGHLDILLYLKQKFNHPVDIPACLVRAAQNGQFHVVKWLCSQTKYDNKTFKKSIKLCQKYNYKYMALWLYSFNKFNKKLKNMSDTDTYNCLYSLCVKGKIKLLSTFFEHIPINIDDRINIAFNIACRYNHLSVAQFLCQHFKINIHNGTDYAFRKACKYNYKQLLLWLVNLDQNINYSSMNNYAFHWSCLNGYLDITQWLYPKLDKPIKWKYPKYPNDPTVLFYLKYIDRY